MAKNMAQQSKLLASLWAEIINIANLLVNKSPIRANDGCTLEHVFNSNKPNLSFLHIFGCDSFIFIPKEERKSKSLPRANNFVFFGYENQSKAI